MAQSPSLPPLDSLSVGDLKALGYDVIVEREAHLRRADQLLLALREIEAALAARK